MTIPTVPAVRPKPSATRAIFTAGSPGASRLTTRSEEHTSELQSRSDLVCRLLLEKKKTIPRPVPGPGEALPGGRVRSRDGCAPAPLYLQPDRPRPVHLLATPWAAALRPDRSRTPR